MNCDLVSVGGLARFQAADREALWKEARALPSTWEQLGLRGKAEGDGGASVTPASSEVSGRQYVKAPRVANLSLLF